MSESQPRAEGVLPADPDDDVFVPVSPRLCRDEDVQRWNDEWLVYLRDVWPSALEPYTAFPNPPPPLPATAREVLAHRVRPTFEWLLYCDPDALLGRRVMELGCGCGGLGKLLGLYAASYLGSDYSSLALQVARLVSPASCTYVHVADSAALSPFHGTIETVVGRFFWIHQNLALARANLELLQEFLVPGGRLYADFFLPDPAREQFIVRSPDEPLSRRWPSATFHYESKDVERCIADLPFRIVREEVVLAMQRRYVVLERVG